MEAAPCGGVSSEGDRKRPQDALACREDVSFLLQAEEASAQVGQTWDLRNIFWAVRAASRKNCISLAGVVLKQVSHDITRIVVGPSNAKARPTSSCAAVDKVAGMTVSVEGTLPGKENLF